MVRILFHLLKMAC